MNDKKKYFYRFTKTIGIILLILFIGLVVTHQEDFITESILKESVPSDEYVVITDGTVVEQPINIGAEHLSRMIFRINWHMLSVRPGSVEISLLDSNGKVVFQETPTLAEVDDLVDARGKMGIKVSKVKRWYKLKTDIDIESDEEYTIRIVGKGIKDDDPLHLYITPEKSAYCENMTVDGEAKQFHSRMRFQIRGVDSFAYYTCIIAPIILILLLLVPYKKREKFNQIVTWGLFLLYPWVTFYMMEYMVGNSFANMGKSAIVLNVLWIYLIYGFFIVLTNRIKVALICGAIFSYLFAMVEYFVLLYRGNPLAPVDFFAAATAKDVIHEYKFEMSMTLFFGTALMLVMIMCAFKLKSYSLFKIKKRLVAVATFVASVFIGVTACSQNDLLARKKIEQHLFNPRFGYYCNGFVLSYVMNIQYITIQKPAGYSYEEVEKIAEKYESQTMHTEGLTQKPNIIYIMNETFSDLSVVNDFETNIPVMPFYDSLTENAVKGDMLVPVFGSGTSNSEYEALTGNSTSAMPAGTNCYAQFLKNEMPSLVTQLKSQGYNTAAFHPYRAVEWNRDKVYNYLGFDNFYDETSLDENARKIRGWVSDEADYDKIIELYEENKKHKENDNPLFLFNVTIQNHGGYAVADKDFHQRVKITDEHESSTADMYLSLIRESDDQLKRLVEYFENQDEPTIIIMFGDHQPKVGDEFYESLYGKSLLDLSLKETQKMYTVPFVIWTNYDIEEQQVEDLSANYLTSLMLDYTNLKTTPYNEFLKEMRKSIPEMNANGYKGVDGKLYTYDDKDSPYAELIKEYSYLQYNALIDKNKCEKLYSVE